MNLNIYDQFFKMSYLIRTNGFGGESQEEESETEPDWPTDGPFMGFVDERNIKEFLAYLLM